MVYRAGGTDKLTTAARTAGCVKRSHIQFVAAFVAAGGTFECRALGVTRKACMGSVFERACMRSRQTLPLSRHEDGELLPCFERMAMGEDYERSEEKKDLGNHSRG